MRGFVGGSALVVLLLLVCLPAAATIPVNDLAQPISIAGQWQFRTGDDLAWAAADLDDSDWQATAVPAHAPVGFDAYSGMLWYRVTLQLDLSAPAVQKTRGALAVTLGSVMSAYELYAGGDKIGGVGRLPPNPEASQDRRQTWAIPASAVGTDGHLMLALRVWRNPEIPNSFETGPYAGDFLLGNVGTLQSDLLRKALLPNVVLATLYLVLGLYHLLIARRNPVLKEFFWFGLLGVVLAGFTFEASQGKYLIDVPFSWHKRFEHLTIYLLPILLGNTLLAVTRTPGSLVTKGFSVVFALYFLTALVVPGDAILSRMLPSFQYLGAIWMLIMAAIMAWRAYEGSLSARVVVVLLLLLVGAVINDVFMKTALIGSGNILYIVLALMLFFMALMMAERYTGILKQLETAVQARTAELTEANRELAAAVETKGNFLANMSHEMRTPMNAILGLTRLGLKTELNTQQRDYFGKVEQSAEGLQDIINSILDFSKLADGELECVSAPFSTASLVEGIRRIWEEPAQKSGLGFVVNVDPDIPASVAGDAQHLKQVLGNFIGNAVKFTNKGQVTLSITLLEQSKQSARLRFAVSDTGVGIAEAQREKLFEAFSQADNSMTREYGGTGLGLAIAQRLVELMGGVIEVESSVGEGSSFSFDLDLPIAASAAESNDAAAGLDLAPIHGARILLVDDSALNLQVAGELLRQAKLYVETAEDGQQAVEKVNAAQFDCVLMDVQMPVMDGYAATEIIRSNPKFKDLPVLAMTANAMPQDRARGAEAGLSAYVPKPIEPDELYGALLHWIKPGERDFDEDSFAEPDDSGETTADLPDSLPGISISDGLKRVAGNTTLYLSLLQDLCKDYADVTTRLQEMLHQADTGSARQLAHKLRGIANNLGADATGAAAEAIELAIKAGEDLAPEALPELAAALAEAAVSQEQLSALIGEDTRIADLDETQRQALFTDVVRAVAENNPEALDWAERLLAAMTEDTGGYAELAAARDALDRYDFAGAGEQLDVAVDAGHFIA